MDIPLIVIMVVLAALVFDFTNGFHDTANAMATSIATGALRPKVAVAVAGVLNLVGAFLSVQVAKTIASGLVDEARITPVVVFAGLVGAILWNLLTWLLGLPSSSSHALIGGLIGATLAAAVPARSTFGTVVGKVSSLRWSPRCSPDVVAVAATYLAYGITAGPSRTARHGSARSGGVGVDGRAGARRQRRAEDDGRDHADPHHAGLAPARSGSAVLGGPGRRGWPSRGHLRRRLADHPDIGQPGQRHPDAPGFHRRDDQRAGHPRLDASRHTRCRRRRCARSDLRRRGRPRIGRGALGVAGRMAVAWAVTVPASAVIGAASWSPPPDRPASPRGGGAVGCGLAIYAASRRNPVTR